MEKPRSSTNTTSARADAPCVAVNKGSNPGFVVAIAEILERGELREERILSRSVLLGVWKVAG